MRNNLCLLLQLDELKDTVLHFLDSLVFSESHAALVGDIVDAALGFGVLSAGTTDLEVVLGGNFLELSLVGGQLGDLDVHGGTDGGAEVGGAESQETKTLVAAEGNPLLDLIGSGNHTAVNFTEVTTHLHGDDAEVILFIAPDKERLGIIVVDTAARGPVSAGVGGLEETVTLLEKEVVIDELLLDILGHASEGVEGTLELTLKTGESGGDLLFHLFVLSLSEARVEGIALHGATATDAGGDDELTLGVNVYKGVDITEVLGGVLVSLRESHMVVLNDGVEKRSEDGVGLSIRGVHTDAGVEVLNTCNKHNLKYY